MEDESEEARVPKFSHRDRSAMWHVCRFMPGALRALGKRGMGLTGRKRREKSAAEVLFDCGHLGANGEEETVAVQVAGGLERRCGLLMWFTEKVCSTGTGKRISSRTSRSWCARRGDFEV